MVNELKYRKELEHLRNEHNTVEAKIAELMKVKVIDQFSIQRLKKQKLQLKESIANLEAMLLGNIVA